MDSNNSLPFEDGHQAEAKSFALGFRSAWFRCKINKTSFRRSQIGYFLEFFDYPDEKVTWTKLYQKPLHLSESRGETRMELMVRPSFPPFYCKSQVPDSYPESDVIAIVDGTWKVGDLVDWWCSGCYWSGKVTQLLGKDEVQIELPEPPVGEGKSYIALCKDLRPSLDWSPEHGWTVPRSRDYGDSHYCASLIRPLNQDVERNNMSNELKPENTEQKVSGLYEAPDSHGEGKATLVKPTEALSRKDGYSSSRPPEMIQSNDGGFLTSLRRSESIESSIMELEELANKIRWLKGLLQFGIRWSNAMKPSWKFLENNELKKR